MKYKFLAVAMLQILSMSALFAQGTVGNGGGPVQAKFRRTARYIHQALVSQNIRIPRVNPERFLEVGNTVNLVVHDDLTRITDCEGSGSGDFLACTKYNRREGRYEIEIAGRGYLAATDFIVIQNTAHEILRVVLRGGDSDYLTSELLAKLAYEPLIRRFEGRYEGRVLSYNDNNLQDPPTGSIRLILGGGNQDTLDHYDFILTLQYLASDNTVRSSETHYCNLQIQSLSPASANLLCDYLPSGRGTNPTTATPYNLRCSSLNDPTLGFTCSKNFTDEVGNIYYITRRIM